MRPHKSLAILFLVVMMLISLDCYAESIPEEFFFVFPLDIEANFFHDYISGKYGVSLEYGGESFNSNGFFLWNGRQVSMTYSFPDGVFSSAGVSIQLSPERQDGSTNLGDAYVFYLSLCDILVSLSGAPTDGWILVDNSHELFSYDLPLHDGQPDDEKILDLLMMSTDRTVSVWKKYLNTSITITRAEAAPENHYDGWVTIHYLSPDLTFPLLTDMPFHGKEGLYEYINTGD